MAIVANMHRPLVVLEEESVQQSPSQISASSTSLSSLCSVKTTSSGSTDAPRKPPRQFHYTDIKQMATTAVGPVPSTSTNGGPLRQPQQPIRIAQPPPSQQHYAGFDRLTNNCTPMTTTFPSNGAADATTTTYFAPYFNSVPSLHNRPSISTASSSTLIHYPGQLQRRRDSVDSTPATNNQPNKMSYNCLMETALAQQRQIDANTCELEESRRLISSTLGTSPGSTLNDKRSPHVGQQVMGLKNRIAHDEREMAKLGAVQREARQLAHHNQLQKRELADLENAYAQDDVQLRKAVDKVDVLRKQLDLLYQRRASAASAAIAQQRKINGNLASNPSTSSNLLTNDKQSVTPALKTLSLQQQQRPQASVGPFQFSNLQNISSGKDEEVKKCSLLPSYGQIDSVVVNGGKSITHPIPSQQEHKKSVRAPPPPFPPPTTSSTMSTFGKEIGNQSTPNHFPMEETHEQRLARGKPDQLSLRADSLTAMKRRSWAQAEGGTLQGESDNIWRYLVEEQKKGRTHISFADIIAARKPTTAASTSATIRSGSDSASEKLRYRHSAIASASATLPPPPIQQQYKPRPKPIVDVPEDELDVPAVSPTLLPSSTTTTTTTTTEDVDSNSESSGESVACSQIPKSIEVSQQDVEEERKNVEVDHLETIKEVENPSEEASRQCITENFLSEPEEEMEEEIGEVEEDMDEPSEFVVINDGGNDEASSTTTDEASTISGDEQPAFENLSSNSQRAPSCKGILRTPGKQHHNRRVVFDQIVLFLDVAYEGEYDMLVQLAKNIPDISVANGEGITALHNAICAGNHDIVKFLIDNNADVNALDSDGWSPLHCAASCNNLVMLKQLIENGACVFATTISKTETAANLFDETHEYEAGAEYIEMVEKCMGLVNEGKVYAAFSYEAQNEDELSFQEGDELRVLQRNDQEEVYPNADVCWWLCEDTQEVGNKGLVPRNYLSLFPIWRHKHKFQPFELTLDGLSPCDTAKWSESETTDGIANPPSASSASRELSTYA